MIQQTIGKENIDSTKAFRNYFIKDYDAIKIAKINAKVNELGKHKKEGHVAKLAALAAVLFTNLSPEMKLDLLLNNSKVVEAATALLAIRAYNKMMAHPEIFTQDEIDEVAGPLVFDKYFSESSDNFITNKTNDEGKEDLYFLPLETFCENL